MQAKRKGFSECRFEPCNVQRCQLFSVADVIFLSTLINGMDMLIAVHEDIVCSMKDFLT